MFLSLHHLVLTILAVSLVNAVTNSDFAPVTVDLGYIVQSATTGVTSNGMSFLNFSNIRYAAAPTGHARFAPPSSPAPTPGIQNGQTAVICPQASAEWINVDAEFLSGLPLTGGPVPNYTEADIPPTDPRTSEDCLFLDVLVPTETFQKGAKAKAAVLVWIHGGGYIQGHKSEVGSGLGLVTTSKANGGPGIVYVAINYRLGLFGWLAGSSFAKQGGTSNAGLLDQRFALHWVKKYISLFGGDPNRITVLGESAGAGAITAHIVSSGGAPFDRAIAQSPYLTDINAGTQEDIYQTVLNSTGTKSLSTLRGVSSTALQKVNALIGGNSYPWGVTELGPVVDGVLISDKPRVLLSKGRYDTSISLLTGHTAADGLLFTDPFIATSNNYTDYLHALFPDIKNASLSYINNTLYPAIYDGSQGYTSQYGRTNATIGEYVILCNTVFLQHAFPDKSWGYNYVVPPGIHGSDLTPTFYDEPQQNVPVNATLATIMQTYFTNFAKTGNPNSTEVPNWPLAKKGVVQNLGNDTVVPAGDTVSDARCKLLLRALSDV
ncbi:hypothetical protein CJF32_00005470 [Rutstroemia sp. NJR-2017a WRK4]|nr:hypothetical protein CJF32_00005470 [Rutstroemia sp. NJR-2017a WRK4]